MNIIGAMDIHSYITILIGYCAYFVDGNQCQICFQEPSFVSPNIDIASESSSDSEKTITHGLHSLPVKVDIQVRSMWGADAPYVYPGLGSAQVDDDEDYPHGGVVYKYNEDEVVILTANKFDNFQTGAVIDTGLRGNTPWIGSNATYLVANVRTRAWSECDFPTADFNSSWQIIRAQNGTDSSITIKHGLGVVPDYVSVQIRLGETTWTTDGIGSSMHTSNLQPDTDWGGVIYAYSDIDIKLWAPGRELFGYVYSTNDGWGHNSNETYRHGYVRVLMWTTFHGESVFEHTVPLGQQQSKVTQLNINNQLDVVHGLLTLTLKTSDGYHFPGMGAAQNSKGNDSFGGIVYSYSNNKVRLWYPDVSIPKKYLVYVDAYWGEQNPPIAFTEGLLVVKAWNPVTNKCPNFTTVSQQTTTTEKSTESSSTTKSLSTTITTTDNSGTTDATKITTETTISTIKTATNVLTISYGVQNTTGDTLLQENSEHFWIYKVIVGCAMLLAFIAAFICICGVIYAIFHRINGDDENKYGRRKSLNSIKVEPWSEKRLVPPTSRPMRSWDF